MYLDKRDRVGTRTSQDIERKYNLRKAYELEDKLLDNEKAIKSLQGSHKLLIEQYTNDISTVKSEVLRDALERMEDRLGVALEDYPTTVSVQTIVETKAGEIETSLLGTIETQLEDYTTTTAMEHHVSETIKNYNRTISETYATINNLTDLEEQVETNSSSIQANATAIGLKLDSSSFTREGVIGLINNGDGTSTAKISADNVDISGFVTVSSLQDGGTTEIDGSRITTGTINAERINLTGYLTIGDAEDTYAKNEDLDDFASKNDLEDYASKDDLGDCASKDDLDNYASKDDLSNGRTTISGGCIKTGKISSTYLDSDVITTSNFSAQNINASQITSGRISTTYLSTSVITTSNFSSQSINASKITSGTIDASKITVKNIDASKITSGTIDASKITVKNIDASKITTGTISTDVLSSSVVTTSSVVTELLTLSGGLKINSSGTANGLELYAPSGNNPYIDFHRNGTTTDFTHRIIANYNNNIGDNIHISNPAITLGDGDCIQIFDTSIQGFIAVRSKLSIVNCTNTSTRVSIEASAFTQSSSRKYKENIKNMTNEEADKILDINIVTYDYKNKGNGTNCRGVIAEDVYQVIPSVVTLAEREGEMVPDGVDYSKFVPYLIKEIQIIKKELEEVRNNG